MTARIQPEEAKFTKGQVNRGASYLAGFQHRAWEIGVEQALAELDMEKFQKSFEAVTWWRELHAYPLTMVAANLRYHVDKADGRIEGRLDVTQRLKRLVTTIDKLGREPGNLTQMHDIGGVRARLPSPQHIYTVRRRLLKTWTIIRERDYIAEPKVDGYRALHLIVRRKGFPIEVQLRTVRQDAWANELEQVGRQLGLRLKFGEGPAEIKDYYVAIGEALAYVDAGEAIPEDVITAVRAGNAMIQDRLPPPSG